MYVLITYDVEAKRTEKFRKLLTRYLAHEQNSVFAGDLTESKLKMLHSELGKIAVPEDRVIQIKADNRHNVEVAILKKNERNGTLETQEDRTHIEDSRVI